MRLIFSILLLFSHSLYAQEIDSPRRIDKRIDYLNPNLNIEKRVDDLVSQMTLEEKVSQMVNSAKAIPRLQIPEYNWWNECLHGVAFAGTATVFPQAIALAATWNTDLMFQIADVISTEARAKHHDFVRKGDRDIFKGLTFWSPNINIFRDPRWGRGQETYGEDPYLTARMGVAFVKGLQGDDPKYFKVIATPKHYAVHSGPEPDRHTFNAIINNRDLYDTYLPAFEACIKEAGAYSVMCAYNRYMGEACCGSPKLLTKILRDDWGFDGYVVSDCGAISDIFNNHKIVKTAPEAAAIAVKSGTDLNCGKVYDSALIEAVKQGILTEEEIDISVKRLFTARFKLGMFDPPEMVKYAQIPIEENDSEEHRQLSIRAARESIVLLKNENNILPLSKNIKTIAVIGPNANNAEIMYGNYNGFPSRAVTPLEGIKNKLGPNAEILSFPTVNHADDSPVLEPVPAEFLSSQGQPGLKAEYYNNMKFEGNPVVSKNDNVVNLNWDGEMPVKGVNKTEISIRWTGKLTVNETGDYFLCFTGDDGYRVFINGKKFVEGWYDQAVTASKGKIHLKAGQPTDIKIEFFQNKGRAVARLEYGKAKVNSIAEYIGKVAKADYIIFVGGISPNLEGEEMPVNTPGFKGGDRTSLDLPKIQLDFLKALKATGKPLILVTMSGSALSINWEKENIPAIIQLWYPGQEGGTALADVLFGDYNPAGRLPITFYKSVDQLPPFEDYNMRGRTYRYFEDEPLFPFGYGLSYTIFEYTNLIVPNEAKAGDDIKISVEVQNTGEIAGDEVVQLYIKDLVTSVPAPVHSLQGFKRIFLEPGEKQVVEFKLQPKQLAVINEDTKFVVEPGIFEISVGGLQPGTKSPTTECIIKEMKIVGKPYVVE